MSRVSYQPLRSTARLGSLTIPGIRSWTSSLGIWAAGAGTAVVFLLSVTPIVRGGLQKLPVVGNYYEDKTPDSDKPF